MKKLFLQTFLLSFSFTVFSQTLPQIQKIKSPEASSIDQVIEVPVSYYTGVPQISIPLYEIGIKGVSVPITLDYNAGGIRVDQEATVVGLGWSLGYGGQISRSVKGKPDEYSFFDAGRAGLDQNSIQHFLDLPDIRKDASLTQRYEYMRYAKSGATIYDYQPDEFHYSGQGFSGRFMYNQPQDKFVFFPKEDIVVDYTYDSTQQLGSSINFNPIESWLMTLPNGTSIKYGLDGISKSGTGTGSPATQTDMWKIKEIKNTTGESITFLHTPVTYSSPNVSSDEYSDNIQEIKQGPWATYNFEDGIIQTITFPNGTVNFQLTNRDDLPTGGKAIQEITVLNTHGQLIRKVTFAYSYFTGEFGDISVSNYLQTSFTDYKRLRLDAVTISGPNASPKVYKFTYITKAITPSKRSFSQDIWGYFNGKANKTWVPRIPDLTDDIEKFGNRTVDPAYTDIFTLNSITYPTGGKTVYEYEANKAQANIATSILAQMEAPALKPASSAISISGINRLDFHPAPTSEGEFGARYFRQSFTIPTGGGYTTSGGWSCRTNFYENNSTDNNLNCDYYNVDFILERVNANGSFSPIKSHRLRQCGSPILYNGNDHGNLPYLNAGNYRMTIVIWYTSLPDNVNKSHSTTFEVHWLEPVQGGQAAAQQFLYAGGIRIKKIKYLDADGTVVREKQYSYNMPGSDLTSGQIVSFPCFIQNFKCTDENGGHCTESQQPGQPPGSCSDVHVFGNPVYGLQTTLGSSLGYEYVTEKTIGDENTGDIVTQYWFSFVEPEYNQYYRTIQEGIREPREWQRGKLRSMIMTKGGVISKAEINEYYELSPHNTTGDLEQEGYVVEINSDLISNYNNGLVPHPPGPYDAFPTGLTLNGEPWIASYWFYNVSDANLPENLQSTAGNLDLTGTIPIPYQQTLPYFKRYTGFDKLKKKITETYDDAGNRVQEIQEFDYTATPIHHQLTRTRFTNSKGIEVISQTKYPTDFPATEPYTTMATRNMIGVPVEQLKITDGVTVSVKTNYATFDSKILPSVVQTKEGANPYEDRFEYLAYNPTGNATLLKRSDDVKITYLYGYRNQYVIAEAENVDPVDLAFVNFEDAVTNMTPGNWALTGSAYITDNTSPQSTTCYQLGGSLYLQKTGLTASRQYTVSYWSKNGSYTVTGSLSVITGGTENSWTYYEHTVTGVSSLTIQGTGRIDNVKLYPKDAIIKTYTYKELVGITSVTDANNLTMSYEYDSQGRLRYIRDNNKNILQSFDYQYSNGN